MRVCRCSKKAPRFRCVPTISGGFSPLPLSHPGKGFPARLSTGICKFGSSQEQNSNFVLVEAMPAAISFGTICLLSITAIWGRYG